MVGRLSYPEMQCTISRQVTFCGVGVHSGEEAVCSVLPAGPDNGISIEVNGTTPPLRVPLGLELVTSTRNATCLEIRGVRLQTVEHLLSALAGLGICNAHIVMEGPEVPILDGSALPFAQELNRYIVPQNVERRVLRVRQPFRFEDAGRSILFEPCEQFVVDYTLDFQQDVLGKMSRELVLGPSVYLEEIAPARTFGFLKDLESYRKLGLAKGASMENTVVYGEHGPLNDLRFTDEPVRHKMLDLVGDLSLLASTWQARVTVVRGGHEVHIQGARTLQASGCAIWG